MLTLNDLIQISPFPKSPQLSEEEFEDHPDGKLKVMLTSLALVLRMFFTAELKTNESPEYWVIVDVIKLYLSKSIETFVFGSNTTVKLNVSYE